jgi:hypothetical protein
MELNMGHIARMMMKGDDCEPQRLPAAVQGNPFDLTRGRALTAPTWGLHDNFGNPRVMDTPTVVEMALPPPNMKDPLEAYYAPRVVSTFPNTYKEAIPSESFTLKKEFLSNPNTLINLERLLERQEQIHQRLMKILTAPRVVRKRQNMELKGNKVKRRKVEQPWSPTVPTTEILDNPTANAPVQVTPIDLTRGRALPEPVCLHDNPMSKVNDKEIRSPRVNYHQENNQKDLVRYGRDKRSYEDFSVLQIRVFNEGNEVLVEIKHRLRRWIARVKMKQVALHQ